MSIEDKMRNSFEINVWIYILYFLLTYLLKVIFLSILFTNIFFKVNLFA